MRAATETVYRIEAMRTDGKAVPLEWVGDRDLAECLARGYWLVLKEEGGYLNVRVRKERS